MTSAIHSTASAARSVTTLSLNSLCAEIYTQNRTQKGKGGFFNFPRARPASVRNRSFMRFGRFRATTRRCTCQCTTTRLFHSSYYCTPTLNRN